MADPKSEKPEITPEDLEAKLLQLMRNSELQQSALGAEPGPSQQRPDADSLAPEEAARLTEAARADRMRASSSSMPPPPPDRILHQQLESDGLPSGDMERHLATMEAHVEHIRNEVASLKADLKDVGERMRRLDEKVSRLPGKSFAVSAALLALALLAALIAFQAKVQAFLGAAR